MAGYNIHTTLWANSHFYFFFFFQIGIERRKIDKNKKKNDNNWKREGNNCSAASVQTLLTLRTMPIAWIEVNNSNCNSNNNKKKCIHNVVNERNNRLINTCTPIMHCVNFCCYKNLQKNTFLILNQIRKIETESNTNRKTIYNNNNNTVYFSVVYFIFVCVFNFFFFLQMRLFSICRIRFDVVKSI